MSNDNTRDDGDQFAMNVTDAVLAILRATVEHTDGPGQALYALTSAVAALQQFILRHDPQADDLIVSMNSAVENMPAELGAGIFAQVLREAQAAREPHPTRFYGEA
jgi:predicted MFS family arabinose efflux permease